MLKKKRLEEVLKRMSRMGIDQMIITDPISILYLTEVWIDACERLVALYINKNGKNYLFVNNMFSVPEKMGVPVIRFADTDPYLEMLANCTEHTKKLGVDKNIPARFLLPLMEMNAGASYINTSICVDEARAIKDEEELETMRTASAINDMAMAQFKKLLKPGVTERQVANQIKEIYQSLGADDVSFPPSVCFGANAAVGHYRCGDVRLKEGDCVLIDTGCIKNNYCSDMTRTFFCGKVKNDKHKEIYELVLAANRAAEAIIKPGVRFCDIDAAARKIISDAGYSDKFTHRLGHFIGMEVHDYGDVSSANKAVAEVGNVFSIEPGIYLEGDAGVRIEDLVIVTENGCEILNSFDKELQIV